MADFTFSLPLLGTLAFTELAFSSVIIGALIDSVNPCAFGVLIFLMTYLMKVFDDALMMLIGGILYTSSVFVTYLLAGIGLLHAVQSPTVSYIFYWVATFVAWSAAAFELKDYLWYGKGVSMEMVGSSRLKQMIHRMGDVASDHPYAAFGMTVPIGFAAAAFELPCTGQVYLAILSLIDAAAVSSWLPWLVLYNLIFVAPLLLLTLLLYAGAKSERLEAWRKENRRYMRLAAGVFLYALGCLLLWFTYRRFPGYAFKDLLTIGLVGSQAAIYVYLYKLAT